MKKTKMEMREGVYGQMVIGCRKGSYTLGKRKMVFDKTSDIGQVLWVCFFGVGLGILVA